MRKIIAFALLAVSTSAFAIESTKYPSIDSSETRVSSSRSEWTSSDPFHGSPNPYSNEFAIGAGMNYFNAAGLQAHYAKRMMENGLIENMNDAIWFEGGVGTTFYGNVKGKDTAGLSLLATGRWDFRYNSKFALFANMGLGYNAVTGAAGSDVVGGNFFPAIGGGALYNFTSEDAARFDLSWQFVGFSYSKSF